MQRSHALLHFFLFFFLRLLLCLKFKPLLRCAYVRYFNLCPEILDAKTGQFASLLGRGWEGMDWAGRGGVLQRPTLERRPGTPPTPEFDIQHSHSNVTYHFPEID